MARTPFTNAVGFDSWFIDEAKAAKAPGACAGEPEWVIEIDVIEDDGGDDDEEPTTVRRPDPASVAMTDIPSPRRRRGDLLLRATLLASAVALTFVLGWWRGARDNPPRTPAAATSASVGTRTDLTRAARILAPTTETPPQAQPATSAPKLLAVPLPRPAAPAPPAASAASTAASAYVPMDL
jgi:hypothetical protein